ncbi:3-isopropylmalate/(R)-2-methylmalate dehydratase small subunit [Herbaspirillum sp. Sphag1AN]|uniref:LeuD/DmdB family oxidoreductase small subunit n=1 Tax=unclassified Herbaspirillum TaxID=2624150 RepID=UPI00160C6E4A|nr:MULTISPECIES: 3-isopropylmalate dehydratase [unclassified Herbaspirillum]MBB3212935.1 3-isopropylmalate/(R)-2-methylmalate dehydratase small subunit [Herbaspirillum sp. Sphag1AN]MBB3246132.1 3-isopropylmalate/(R)-2-methylmalate dehydratase small subunit [Herbaspirillum sp. Sphag64]
MTVQTTLRGRAWKFEQDISSDQLISARHVFEFDPRLLSKHLLHELRPELAQQAKPGDVIVAGAHFAHGSNHSHPFLAMQALGVGLLCRSLSRGPFRLAIFMGVPLLQASDEVIAAIEDGQQLEIDFRQGRVINLSTGASMQAEPLSPFLQEIVQAGGGMGFIESRLINK